MGRHESDSTIRPHGKGYVIDSTPPFEVTKRKIDGGIVLTSGKATYDWISSPENEFPFIFENLITFVAALEKPAVILDRACSTLTFPWSSGKAIGTLKKME